MTGRGMWSDDKGDKKPEHPEPSDKPKLTEEQLEAQRHKIAEQRRLDEGATMLADHFPRLWRSLYEGLLNNGFDEGDAMSLLKCYVLKDGINGVHVHKG